MLYRISKKLLRIFAIFVIYQSDCEKTIGSISNQRNLLFRA